MKDMTKIFYNGIAFFMIFMCALVFATQREAFAIDPWPGGAESTRIDITQSDMGGNMSGVFWNPVTQKLWVVSNGGIFWRMSCQGDPDIASSWVVDSDESYVAKWSPGGDTEAITQANYNEQTIFIGVERWNGNYRLIQEYDVSGAFGQVVKRNEWNLLEMKKGNDNDGLESLAFVPDEWLKAKYFTDKNGNPYTSSQYGTGGLFFAGLQLAAAGGGGPNIFVFDLNRDAQGQYYFVGEYTHGQSEIAELFFDRSNGILYSYHNCYPDVLQALNITTTGTGIRAFPSLKAWYGPRIANNEGIAILSNSEGDSNDCRRFFLTTDDAGTSNSVGIYSLFPCHRMRGDISGNGKILSYDAALALNYKEGLFTLTPGQRKVGDVNGDFVINNLDIDMIGEYSADLIGTFPATGYEGINF